MSRATSAATAHTPGLLYVVRMRGFGGLPVLGRRPQEEADKTAGDYPIAGLYEGAPSWDNKFPAHANAARLAACWNACDGIADPEKAVPALLDALRKTLAVLEPMGLQCQGADACRDARAAIAAATGEQQ